MRTLSPIPLPEGTSASLGHAALAYAEAGLPVFPLQPRGKTPRVAHGFHAATTSSARIRHWWRQWPDANIGIPTGQPSGWLVLDVDPRHGGHDSLAHLQRKLAHQSSTLDASSASFLTTRSQRTGGAGLHLVFQQRAEMPLHSTVTFAGYPGLDLRGEHGYIVVAPSQHTSGAYYSWINQEPVLPFPDALLDLLHTRQHVATTRLDTCPRPAQRVSTQRGEPDFWLAFVLARVQIGNRHQQALFLACRLLQETALSPTQAQRWMREYARCVPQSEEQSYPVSDALQCLSWAATHVR